MRLEKELFSYIIFGILTTLVNFIIYFIFIKILGINYIISNIVAWFFSVLFAYITNRIWVFESKDENIIKEISLFFSGRLFSGAFETGLLFLFVDILFFDNLISKIAVHICGVVLNYIFSKLIVFK